VVEVLAVVAEQVAALEEAQETVVVAQGLQDKEMLVAMLRAEQMEPVAVVVLDLQEHQVEPLTVEQAAQVLI
jgi:hypothetical protein